jgi:hypothetical protein
MSELTFPRHEECYVKLDKYTINVVVGSAPYERRWWAPFSGPVICFPSFEAQKESCDITLNDGTRTITLAQAERILIEFGLIDPELDDPEIPVYAWTAFARGQAA